MSHSSAYFAGARALSCLIFTLPCALGIAAGAKSKVDFNQDIRPILSDNCYACHGPDAGHRKAGLRLDVKEGALADLGGYHAVVPGNLAKSELITRVTTKDE